MESTHGGNEPFFPGIKFSQLHGPVNSLGAAVGKKTILNIARGQFCDNLGQMRSQWIQHLLAVLGAPVQLGFDGSHDLRMTDAGAVQTEPA